MSAILGAPWRQTGATIEDSDGCTVAVMSVRHDGSGPLLAAAPEMIAALEAAAPHHQGGHSEVGRMIRAALAKAKAKGGG